MNSPRSDSPTKPEKRPFTVIGIGANQTDLPAVDAIVSGIPADNAQQLAIVLVVPHSADNKRLGFDKLHGNFSMPVVEIQHGMAVQSGCIYLTSENQYVAIQNRTLQLVEPFEPVGERRPIDFFFRSLATEQRERAIGIILSDVCVDGMYGSLAIRREGGLMMSLGTATTGSHPHSRENLVKALADYELSPGEMSARIVTHATRCVNKSCKLANDSALDNGHWKNNGQYPAENVNGTEFTHAATNALQQPAITLTHTTDLLENISELAKIGGWEVDLQTGRSVWTRQTRRIHEVDGAFDPMLTNAMDFYPPEARRVVETAVQAGISDGTPWSFELPIITAKGRQIWVHAQGAVEMQDGKAIRLFGVLQDITERKRYEQTLWETNERFIAAFEHAPIGVALVMPDGRFIKVNRAICELVGYDRAELLSLAFQDITHPDDLESDLKNIRRVLGGEISKYEMEKKYVHKHGHFITVLLSVSLVRGDQGQPCYFIKQIQDITARKVAESALKDSEERLREAQTIAQIGSFHWNARTDHVWWSDETYRIYGHTSAGFVPTFSSYIAAIHPDDRLQVEESLHNVIAAKGEFDHEYQILWPDGSTRSVHAKVRANLDRNGDFCGLEGTCQDITDRKRTLAALEQSEARLRIVTGCARVGLVVADTERRFVFANAAYSSIANLPDHQTLLGRHLADVLPDVYEERIKPRLDRAFAGERIDYEAQFPTAKGIVHCVVNYEPVFAGDHVSNVVAVVMGVTAQRNTEEQLRQSQKMETVGQLAGGIAHDFNNLLTIIGGYTDLLLNMHSKTDPAWDSLNEIRMASNRASDLTQRLMAFGRRKMRSPESMDLNAMILDTQTLLQRSVGDGVQIVYSLSEDLKQIWMDRSELTQVLLNLAINARDAMQNTGRLEIQTRKVEIRPDDDRQYAAVKPGKYVLLRVSDSGCGMSAEVQARIFEPFFTTKPVGKGTGLGLATVHGIVGGCGGGIHVSSEVNLGTTFEIYLPQASKSDALPEKNCTSKIPCGGNETILLVEDEHSVRRLSRAILTEYGYDVIEAENGEEALEIFSNKQNAIHMLVTDVIMPGSDGVHLAEQILKLDPGLPVLFMSGYIGESKVWDCLTEMEFLQKPFVPIELAHKVRQMLDTS